MGLASGAAHNTPLIRDGGSPAGQRLEGALTALMEGLAKAGERGWAGTQGSAAGVCQPPARRGTRAKEGGPAAALCLPRWPPLLLAHPAATCTLT